MPPDHNKLERLKSQYVVAAKQVIGAIWDQGILSDAYRQAEQQRIAIAAQIRELFAKSGVEPGGSPRPSQALLNHPSDQTCSPKLHPS